MANPVRNGVLNGCQPVVSSTINLTPLPHAARWILRANEKAAKAIAQSHGLAKAPAMLRAKASTQLMMARLGPDEYLIEADNSSLEGAVRSAVGGEFVAFVDIGHRMASIRVEGQAAADTINGACPLDLHLSTTPVSTCTRTVMSKAEVILHRENEQCFRLTTNRSLAEYLWRLLTVLAREHHGEPA